MFGERPLAILAGRLAISCGVIVDGAPENAKLLQPEETLAASTKVMKCALVVQEFIRDPLLAESRRRNRWAAFRYRSMHT
jgi:hypothetical protein